MDELGLGLYNRIDDRTEKFSTTESWKKKCKGKTVNPDG